MANTSSVIINLVPLEQPATVRRQQTLTDEKGWLLPAYCVGPENQSLNYLFDDLQIGRLPELSPILLYGSQGVGKTCLAVTLAVRWSRLMSARPLHFTTGANFVKDYAAAVEIDDLEHFHNRHRRSKLLVIDDLEPIFAKPAAQLALLLTLDAMAEEQRPVILSLGHLPTIDAGILPALASRLVAGYSIEVRPPSNKTRDEILHLLIKRIDASLPFSSLAKVIPLHNANLKVADIQALVLLASQHRKISGSIDADVLKNIADQLVDGSIPTLPLIAKAVAKRLGIKLTDIRGSTRLAKIVRARALAILLSRKFTTHSLHHIGQYFGGRDHSTVLHSCRKTEKLLATDAELAAAKLDVEIDIQSKKCSLI